MYNFNVQEIHDEVVEWIRDWFNINGPYSNAVIGMSGGKDSTIVAALCAEALGPERVIGVAMPDVGQGLNGAEEICNYLGITYIYYPIHNIVAEFRQMNNMTISPITEQTSQNIPPRVRMTVLYAIAQSLNGRPANTCNLSEDFVGYATLFGDAAGSFSPLGKLTVTEIIALGDYMKLPYEWVHKTPDDGLPHSSPDEEKFGFTYAELDAFIREEIDPVGFTSADLSETKLSKIMRMHESNKFKTQIIQIPAYEPDL